MPQLKTLKIHPRRFPAEYASIPKRRTEDWYREKREASLQRMRKIIFKDAPTEESPLREDLWYNYVSNRLESMKQMTSHRTRMPHALQRTGRRLNRLSSNSRDSIGLNPNFSVKH